MAKARRVGEGPKGEACGNCYFFRANTRKSESGILYGECRRFPPSAFDPNQPSKYVPAAYPFPIVYNEIWCGEFQAIK